MRLKAAAIAVAALTIMAGCSTSSDKSGTSRDSGGSGAPKPPDKVSYATGFGAVGRDAFIWVARDKGFFAEAGIEVEKPYMEPLGRLDQQRVADGITELTNAGLMPAGLTPAAVADFSFCSGTPTTGCS